MKERHPGWTILPRPINGAAEIFVPDAKLVLVDLWAYRNDPRYWLAHVTAHLDLHVGDLEDEFTRAQEGEADWLAQTRIGT